MGWKNRVRDVILDDMPQGSGEDILLRCDRCGSDRVIRMHFDQTDELADPSTAVQVRELRPSRIQPCPAQTRAQVMAHPGLIRERHDTR